MSEKYRLPGEEAELLTHIMQVLNDPQQQHNPLRAPLEQLLHYCEAQQKRLERLVTLADGYYSLSRNQTLTLEKEYDRQLRRIEKLMRIADGYQNSLKEMSESLKEASLHDPLTSLGNRRYLIEQLEQQTYHAKAMGSAYCLGIMDVDFFKTVNDQYGHDTGDSVLRDIAHTLKTALRSTDICSRWGGEEFLFVLPDTTMDTAVEIAERVSQAVKGVYVPGTDVNITASIGLTQYSGEEPFENTIKRADTALRHAKSNGRDCIEAA